jgi:hypothetical protein
MVDLFSRQFAPKRIRQRVFLSSGNRRLSLQLEKDPLREGRRCALTTRTLKSGANLTSRVNLITHRGLRRLCRARYIFSW